MIERFVLDTGPLYSRERLGILSYVVVHGEQADHELMAALAMSDVELSRHSRILRRAGFLDARRTRCNATPAGRNALQVFLSEIEQLSALLKEMRGRNRRRAPRHEEPMPAEERTKRDSAEEKHL